MKWTPIGNLSRCKLVGARDSRTRTGANASLFTVVPKISFFRGRVCSSSTCFVSVVLLLCFAAHPSSDLHSLLDNFEPSIEESSEMPRLPGGRRRQAPSRQQQRQDTEKGTDEAMDTEQVDREPVQADTDNGDVQSGTATCTETTSSAAASEETSESSLSRDQVPAACMPCEVSCVYWRLALNIFMTTMVLM